MLREGGGPIHPPLYNSLLVYKNLSHLIFLFIRDRCVVRERDGVVVFQLTVSTVFLTFIHFLHTYSPRTVRRKSVEGET